MFHVRPGREGNNKPELTLMSPHLSVDLSRTSGAAEIRALKMWMSAGNRIIRRTERDYVKRLKIFVIINTFQLTDQTQ